MILVNDIFSYDMSFIGSTIVAVTYSDSSESRLRS